MPIQFKGDSLVLTGSRAQRTPFGAWSTSYDYSGIPISIAALVNNQRLGAEISVDQTSIPARASLTYPPDVFADKWEIDKEVLEKDIMYHPVFALLSPGAFAEIRRWRQDPTGSDMFLTPGVPITTLQGSDGKTSQLMLSPNDLTPMGQLKELVLRGTEAFQIATLIAKRTRQLSVPMPPTLDLSEQTQFYSTTRFTSNENVPALGLPTNPYSPPTDTQWGWLPRLRNRSYVSRGFMEEHSDWVFAAWSTILYTYVP